MCQMHEHNNGFFIIIRIKKAAFEASLFVNKEHVRDVQQLLSTAGADVKLS